MAILSKPDECGAVHTERLASEIEVARQLSAMFDAMADAACLLDAECRVIRANEAFEHFAGKSADKINNRTIAEFFPALASELDAPLQRARNRMQRETADFFFQDHWHTLAIHPMLDAHKDFSGVALIIQDITERKMYDEHLSQMQRLDSLATLVSGIAHDFNNILMPILGLSDILLNEPDGLDDKREVRNAMVRIHSAAKDAREIVRRLRGFYGADETVEMRQVDLRAVVNDAIRLTQPHWKSQAQAEGRLIRITTAHETQATITANEKQLREVITNLILNSMDAMPSGGTIHIRTFETDSNAILEVSDTGTGMVEEVRRRCLEPFFTTKGKHGTGLGLSMCHGIVKRLHGSIEIESEIGKGTTIRIKLPLPEKSEGPDAPEGPMKEKKKPLRILVVDDEEESRALLHRLLTNKGHLVELCAGGKEGLEKIREQPFDVIITDRAMPQMNGEQFAIAARKAAPCTPILMLTGFGGITITSANKPDSVDLIAGTPVTGRELYEMIEKLVNRKKAP